MPTPIRVSFVKRRDANDGLGVEGLGGTFPRGRWYMSEQDLIREIEKPYDVRRWDFYVQAGFRPLPLIVSWAYGRKYLTAVEPLALLRLPEWPHGSGESVPA
jgi:hypothetical protein